MRFLAVCLLAAACAAPAGPSRHDFLQTRLVAGAPIAAPEGLAEYCVRAPSECQGAPRPDLRGRMPATGGAFFQNAAYDAGAAEGSVFHALIAARLAQGAPQAASAASARMILTDARWGELRGVNREINRAIRPSTDRALYGVEEYWDRPLQTYGPGARGDCEDYALEKRARLLGLGWAPEMLALAVAIAPRVGLHAVLLVQTDQGDFVLDNLYDQPRALADLDYVWLSRQMGPSLTSWAAAQAQGAPAAQRTFADVSAEAMFERMMMQRASARAPEPQTPAMPEPVQEVALAVRPAPALLKPEEPGEAAKPSARVVRDIKRTPAPAQTFAAQRASDKA